MLCTIELVTPRPLPPRGHLKPGIDYAYKVNVYSLS